MSSKQACLITYSAEWQIGVKREAANPETLKVKNQEEHYYHKILNNCVEYK